MSVFIAHNCAGGRAGEGAAGVGIVWYCASAGAGEGLEEGGAGALYQAHTGSRLLPTHRPWRLTTPPSPFFALSRLSIAGVGGDDGEFDYSALVATKVSFFAPRGTVLIRFNNFIHT